MPARRRPSLTGPGHFHFLNQSASLDEHGWDDEQLAKLLRYNQHYFDDLNASEADARADWHASLIDRWLCDNPPGTGTAWEPYPTSLRIVNWIKWDWSSRRLDPEAIQSLAVQGRWLMNRLERHLLGNHLFSNAKALVFLGAYFDGAEASQWLDAGLRILETELEEQILLDGGHFELSTMYHALAVEDALDLVNLFDAAAGFIGSKAEKIRSGLISKLPLMLVWLDRMCHPDGEISFFNDAAMGIAPTPSELFSYANRLGLVMPPPREPTRYFPESGYARLEKGPATAIVDVARVGPDYLPGHAHADTLSFELSLRRRRLIVNSGTSQYGVTPARSRERSTAAHSTLVVDGENSSDVWAGFRVGRRAYPRNVAMSVEPEKVTLSGSHDGYVRLRGQPLHRRTWTLSDRDLIVDDEVIGRASHRLEIIFYLAPGVKALDIATGNVQLVDCANESVIATVQSESTSAICVEPASWHPEFGTSFDNQRLRICIEGSLPQRHRTRIWW